MSQKIEKNTDNAGSSQTDASGVRLPGFIPSLLTDEY